MCRKANLNPQKLSPLTIQAENLLSVLSSLKRVFLSIAIIVTISGGTKYLSAPYENLPSAYEDSEGPDQPVCSKYVNSLCIVNK